MNSVCSGKKRIVLIQGRNESRYSGKKLIMLVQERNE
jgi:hypothetical protein